MPKTVVRPRLCQLLRRPARVARSCVNVMALRRPRWLRPFLPFKHLESRPYATIKSPNQPLPTSAPRPLDRFVLESLARTLSTGRTALPRLIQQYLDRSGNVLDAQLPYEPHPSPSRRVSFTANSGGDVHLIAHVARENDRNRVSVSSGFALETSNGQPILVTCAHTLEEVCRPPGALCIYACR